MFRYFIMYIIILKRITKKISTCQCVYSKSVEKLKKARTDEFEISTEKNPKIWHHQHYRQVSENPSKRKIKRTEKKTKVQIPNNHNFILVVLNIIVYSDNK